jgi:PadR family transcriptional regulator PadR
MERLKEYGLGNIDPSLIYRALHALEGEGLVSSTWDKEESQGPPRRVYALTAFGKQELDHYMDELKDQRDRIERLLQAYNDHVNNR